jgi:hypothetical protein
LRPPRERRNNIETTKLTKLTKKPTKKSAGDIAPLVRLVSLVVPSGDACGVRRHRRKGPRIPVLGIPPPLG